MAGMRISHFEKRHYGTIAEGKRLPAHQLDLCVVTLVRRTVRTDHLRSKWLLGSADQLASLRLVESPYPVSPLYTSPSPRIPVAEPPLHD
jgi:hypothetical protein